jgi:dipeptidyl aminopeptidase/acylaminoacyl peptidase
MKVTSSRVLRLALVFIGSCSVGLVIAADSPHPIAIDDLLRIPRVADVQLSPDGQTVAYTVATPNVATNETDSNLWIVDPAKGTPMQITHTGKDRAARWAPDGKRLAFLSRRDGKSQVYLLSLGAGEARAVTRFPTDVETLRWAPDGRTLIFTAVVDPACQSEDCIKASAERRAAGKAVRVYEHWPVRSAMAWVDTHRSHIFAVSSEGAPTPRDLTPGPEFDVPIRQSIDGSVDGNDIAVSPDSKEICFAAGAGREADGQMFSQLFRVSLAGGAPKPMTSGASNSRTPAWSPDGKLIAYRTQVNGKNIGGERWQMRVYSLASGAVSNRTAEFDRSVSGFAWSAKANALYFVAEDESQAPLYMLPAGQSANPKVLVTGFVGDMSATAASRAVAFTRSSLSAPSEVFFLPQGSAAPRQLTHHTDAVTASFRLSAVETFRFESTDSTSVQALYLPPPALDPQRKYPLVVLLHGGPETMWGNSWSYRWNPQVFAAAGYGVLMINRRGSTGYGQKFTDGVVAQWGGAPYADIMSGVDAALERYGYLDKTRIAAAGASYGGYMANWLATHTDRFKTIVSHAGVFDLTSMYAMDLQSFLEFEQAGTPWSAPARYREWSPSTYASALGKFGTPMLVTTGDRDYRVPYMQSLELYAALQRQGVESKLLVFPEEGHWILKPQSSKLWYATVIEWITKHL